jgi:azobenzene reductase
MKTAIVLGSVRAGRQTSKVAHYIEKKLSQRGIEVDLIDLAEAQLPILEGTIEEDSQLMTTINNVSHRLQDTDSIIFVTPEYHGSFSGVLKNALDYFWIEFSRKPIAVATVSSGKLGGINASTQLQHVILSLGAYPLPTKLLISEVQNSFDEMNEPMNERIVKSTTRFLDEFEWFSDAILNKKKESVAKAS